MAVIERRSRADRPGLFVLLAGLVGPALPARCASDRTLTSPTRPTCPVAVRGVPVSGCCQQPATRRSEGLRRDDCRVARGQGQRASGAGRTRPCRRIAATNCCRSGIFRSSPSTRRARRLTPTNDTAVIQVATSTGAVRKMRRVGTLEFSLKGQPLKLTAFVEVGAPNVDHLFVPFNDLTSGTETLSRRPVSGPGSQRDRHLRDRLQPRLFSVLLLQPHLRVSVSAPENRLKVPIRAGERFKTSPG